jgi:arylsulfatase A-like enzyme
MRDPRSTSEWAALALLLLVVAGLPACRSPAAPGPAQPNVVLILIDDLGWADTGAYGSAFHETPNIDRLAREGMRFTQAYAASPVCSPTRSSIMTGRHPARLRQTDWIPGMDRDPSHKLLQVDDKNQLPLAQTTLAEALRSAGYTTAHIGKWHLGGEDHRPTDQGFDANVAGNQHGSPPGYFWPYKEADYQLEELAATGSEGEYLTARLAEEAAQFISDHQNQPFFLHFAPYAVHTPLQAPDSLVQEYRAKANAMERPDRPMFGDERGYKARLVQRQPVYAAMVEMMDRAVGRVRAALEATGQTEETVLIFFSDNGGLSTDRPSTSNYPLRAGKGWLYEGGIRVPLLVKWPGVTPSGSTSDELVMSTDLFPTIMEMTGTPIPEDGPVDGRSLAPVLRQGNSLDRETMYWHYPHYHGAGNTPSGAIRRGDFKLIEYFEGGVLELYHLGTDPGEEKDLSATRLEETEELHRKLQSWRDAVDAQMPEPNPNYTGSPE